MHQTILQEINDYSPADQREIYATYLETLFNRAYMDFFMAKDIKSRHSRIMKAYTSSITRDLNKYNRTSRDPDAESFDSFSRRHFLDLRVRMLNRYGKRYELLTKRQHYVIDLDDHYIYRLFDRNERA